MTSTSLAPSVSTTSSAPLFQKKPLLICQLTSPGYFAPGRSRQAIASQEVPSATICDYTLLDLPLLPNGTYEADSYDFINSVGSNHRLLFNVDLDATDLPGSLAKIRSTSFNNSVHMAQISVRPHEIYGLGIIKGFPVLDELGATQAAQIYLNHVYDNFNELSARAIADPASVRNFFAFKPNEDVIRVTYAEYLTVLNRIDGLSIVIILTITDEEMRQVMPSSSWDNKCLPQKNESTLMEAVKAILEVRKPRVNYTLTLSLRLDVFDGVSFTSFNRNRLSTLPVALHEAVGFATICDLELFARDPMGASILYINNNTCAFAPGRGVNSSISFEVPATVRRKIIETYRWIGYSTTSRYVVGWTVYNVTNGLAPAQCFGHHNRINEIRRNTSRRRTTPNQPPVSPRPSSAPVPIVTSPFLTTSVSTTTVIPLFQQKPLLICHLVSPGYFAPGRTRDTFSNQEVPSATICDYTLLDLPLPPSGAYEAISYDFISKVADHRLLFNVDLDATNTSRSLTTVQSGLFRQGVGTAQISVHPNKIYGLGFIKGLPILESTGGAQATKSYLGQMYSPNRDVIRLKYLDYLSLLNSINGLSIVIILTITDEEMMEVMPSSSWDYSCLPQFNQTTMFCYRELFQRDQTGASIVYLGTNGCAFASGAYPNFVISFDTPTTARHKMIETYRWINYSRTSTHVVGWTVYNVTRSLAPPECLGYHNHDDRTWARNISAGSTTSKVRPVPPRPSVTTAPAPIVTSPTMTPPIPTTTVIPLFQQKPLLICQLMSPGYFALGPHRNTISSQEVPNATICDYTLLDLPLLPNGTYENVSYDFISRARPDHRLLFNFEFHPLGLVSSLATVQSTSFRNSVQTAQNSVAPSKIYGLGVIKGLPILESLAGSKAAEPFLHDIYISFIEVLTKTGLGHE
ncbi:hypothetical protein MTO96_010194 [Rhipicephalus appendiculatus]